MTGSEELTERLQSTAETPVHGKKTQNAPLEKMLWQEAKTMDGM